MNNDVNQDGEKRLPEAFPSLAEDAISALSRTPERDLHILRRRFALDGTPTSTLEELGACHDLTRERVRQIQVQSVNRILEVLSGTKYSKKFQPATALRHDFEGLRGDLEIAPGVLTRREFKALIEARCGSVVEPNWFGLFANLLDMRRLEPTSQVPCSGLNEMWCACNLLSGRDVDALFEYLNGIRAQAGTTNLPRMMVELKAILHGRTGLAALRIILENFEPIELHGDEVRVRTNWLKYCNDQLFRVLEDADEPLSRDEIVRRFNVIRVRECGGKPLRAEDVGNRLSGDDRFVHAGRSGIWALASWNRLQEMTIVEAMQHALHAAGRPLKMQELVSRTQRLRPDAARNSVVTYSGQESEFVRMRGGAVGLAVWKLSDQLPARDCSRLKAEDFLAAVELVKDGRTEVPLAEMVEDLAELLDKAAVTMRQALHKVNGVEIVSISGSRAKLIRFKESGTLSLVSRKKTLKRERIQCAIRQCMYESREKISSKTELYQKVNEKVPCQKPTFYLYLREMNVWA